MHKRDSAVGNTRVIGLVVNPIAGMGGAVGLKGTDGRLGELAAEAGAVANASRRAATALAELGSIEPAIRILTCRGSMGADAVREAGMQPTMVHQPDRPGSTTAADTTETARGILEHEPALLLFAGGDGTARDLLEVVGDRVPVLGIPAGVKMHSSVFAASPRAAGQVAGRFLTAEDPAAMLESADVLDREDVHGQPSPKLYGSMTVPRLELLMPGAKASSRLTDRAALAGALDRVRQTIDDGRINLVGPGSTMRSLKRALGFDGTLLGVDAVCGNRVIGTDLGERDILGFVRDRPARIVMSVVGGQGFLFGRGNQQLSPAVIRTVGRENILVVSSQEKLLALSGGSLLVDSGDAAVDRMLAGYIPVLVSARRSLMMPVRSTSGGAAS